MYSAVLCCCARAGGVRGPGRLRGGVSEPRRMPRVGLPEAREPPAAARREGPPALSHRRRARLLLHVRLQLVQYAHSLAPQVPLRTCWRRTRVHCTYCKVLTCKIKFSVIGIWVIYANSNAELPASDLWPSRSET